MGQMPNYEALCDVLRQGLRVTDPTLFTGPPGCGKIHLSQKFVQKEGFAVEYINCSTVSDISDLYKMRALFARPTIIFLDEVDKIRGDLISNLKALLDSSLNPVLAFAYTEEGVDGGLRVRFDRHIHMTEEVHQELFQEWARNNPKQ